MNAAELVGGTPLVELSRFNPNPQVRLFGKMEGNNPGGSVKDRPARWMIEKAEERGTLRPGMRLIEPTSGNTGIALAMIAAIKGYELELVMPETATVERVQTMRAYGAKVTLTSGEGGMEGAIDYAREVASRGDALMINQFGNPDNWLAHYESTGPEIWEDTDGAVTHFVSAMGTTGTIMGVSRYLKERASEVGRDVTIIGGQPTAGSQIPGIRRWPEEYIPKIYEPSRVDRIVDVSREEAENTTRELARTEGILTGVSAGGAAHIAREVCKEISAGVVVFVLCDRGDRYLSSGIFGQ